MGFFDSLQFGRPGITRAPNDTEELGRGGPRGLRDLILKYFLPELERARTLRGGIEEAFLDQASTPGGLFGAASEAASGKARELFAPGGEVASLIGRARGQTIRSGFAPEAAAGGEFEVLRGATQRVSDVFAQQAGALEQTRFQGLAGAFGLSQEQVRDLIESIFTGVGSAEQLGLAKKSQQKKGLFGLGFGPF